jgi:hypothetical protein
VFNRFNALFIAQKKESIMQKIITTSIFIFLITYFPVELIAGDEELKFYMPTISGQWFMGYQYGEEGDQRINVFFVRRGYIIIKKQITETLSGRITPDISLDKEGDGEGDIELRLKYLYAKYQLPDLKIFTQPFIEFGLTHRPWLDFEEHMNSYRVQGTMFLERNHIFNSADLGFLLVSNIGGKIDEEYQKKVNKKYPGKYGSIVVGIFNGGGYHAIEKNTKKTVEGRFSLRPLPTMLAGFQMTYHGIYGNGNTKAAPKWTVNQGFLSFEREYYILTAQYYTGIGNSSGSFSVADTSIAYYKGKNEGYSLFGRAKIGNSGFEIFGRYDSFNADVESLSIKSQRYIFGISYYFTKASKVLFGFDHIDYKDDVEESDSVVELSVELYFE